MAVAQLQVGVAWVREAPFLGLLALMFTFMMVSMLGVFIMLPGTPPTIGAGFIFGCALGFWKGLPFAVLGVWLGDATGSFIVFMVVRKYLKGYVMNWLKGIDGDKKRELTPEVQTRRHRRNVQDSPLLVSKRSSSITEEIPPAPKSNGSQKASNSYGWVATAFCLLKALDRALEENGGLLAWLLRLSPFFPFSSINYLLAVSSISITDYLKASPALLPGVIAYVIIGSSISAGTDQCNLSLAGEELADHQVGIEGLSGGLNIQSGYFKYLKLCLVIVGMAASLGALTLISQHAKKNLDKIIEQEERHQRDGNDIEITL